MRPRLIGCLAVAVLIAVAGPVWASGGTIGFPSRAILVNVAIPGAERPLTTHQAEAARVDQPAPTRILPAPAVKALPAASKPSDLVRVVYAIKAGDTPQAVTAAKGVCPAAPTCDIFGITGYRLKTDRNGTAVIDYKYNDANRRDLRSPDPPAVRDAIHAAAAAWHHWDSNIVMRDAGNTTAEPGALGRDGTCSDGINTIGWGRVDDPDVVGEATMCLDKTEHVIRDADIVLNISMWWSNGPNPRRAVYDVQEILTHEMGHWLSLTDQYSDTSSSQTMHGSADPNETRKRTPALGDVIGLQTAYPCGSGDNCPRSGIVKD